MAYATRHDSQAATASGLDVLAGIWILISPFALGFSNLSNACWNNVIFGIIIGVIALYRFFNPAKAVGLSWLDALLGLWVLISPWALHFSGSHTAMTNDVIMGIVVIVLAAWSALASSSSTGTGNTNQGSPAM
jgi:hypothetical protein